jgi:branched-chain amino acid transport system substrate-binding protein
VFIVNEQQQRALVGCVKEQRSGADAGPLRDFAYPCGLKPVFVKDGALATRFAAAELFLPDVLRSTSAQYAGLASPGLISASLRRAGVGVSSTFEPNYVNMKFAIRTLIIGTLACLVPGVARAQGAPIEITALYPMTGPAAFIGQGQSQTLRIIEQMVNAAGGIHGRSLKFLIQDDQGNPATAVQLANSVIARKAAIFMGPGLTAECAAVAPLIKSGPVDYCMSPGIDPPAGSYVYSAGMAGPDLARLYVRYFHLRGWNRVALITSTDATGQNFDRSFNDALAQPENAGVHLVDREHFNITDLSVDAQMARIKTATPQVLVAWTAGGAFGTLLHGIQESGLSIPIGGGGANMTYSQMDQFKSVLPKEMLFPSVSSLSAEGARPGPIRDAQMVYRRAFKAAGIRPDFQNNIAWDPAMIIVDAYRSIGPDATAEQLQNYIQHLHSWTGINGIYDFRDGKQRGITLGVGVVVRWDAAKNDFVTVSKPGGYPK